MKVIEDYIISCGELKGVKASENNNLLFLVPDIMDAEIDKIKDKCPIYKQVTPKGINHIFYNNYKRVTDEHISMLYNLPQNVIIPIGEVASPYLLVRGENGFGIVNRSTNIMMLSKSHELKYFGNYVLLSKEYHSYLVDSNGPKLLSGEVVKIDMPNDCVCTKDIKNNYYLCTNNGNFIARSDKFWELYRIALKENTAKKETINLPKDITMFEQMLIKKLKTIPELKERCENNLFDLIAYAYSIGLELVLDLDNLIIYRVSFEKYLKITENGTSIWIKDEGTYTTNKLDSLVRKRRSEENA